MYKHVICLCRLGVIVFLFGGLLSCGSLNQSGFNASTFRLGANITPIQGLKPEQNNTTVYIQGKVEKIVPLLSKQRVYQINDSTGKIWVLTNQTGLEVGEQAVIKGQLRYQTIPLAGKDFGEVYLEEQ
ncbi:MAG: hypothetical protein KME60_25325 [Cyanomargarita calcarea GSE-NOS-MK-12-04C]|uniref:Uncharacterized protein n=1 Tax=Cyanomargarita calcarea GSE-NOS-MK-12-04C TaxID=2839659 RepID=A0A951UXJ8_9CYAN|nr:hypothetical protein [Cyanomargarita calcarea GSE-NOS-MK-12-04C]